MQNPNVVAITPELNEKFTAYLQAAVIPFAQRAKERGFVRLDMGLLKDALDSQSGIVADSLLTEIRTIVEAVDPTMKFKPVDIIFNYVRALLPNLNLPAVTFVDYPARAGKEMIDPTTGVKIQTQLKATRASFFGTPPSSLSQAALDTNARVAAKIAALMGTTVPSAPVTPPPAAPTTDILDTL